MFIKELWRIDVDIEERNNCIKVKFSRYTSYATTRYMYSRNRYYYRFALVLIFIDMLLSQDRQRYRRALFRYPFLSFGESVVVDICVRYFEASLTLVADTTVEPPKIVRAMTPRLYIPPVCRVVLQKGLMPSEFAQSRHDVAREIFFPSLVYSIY